MALSIFKWLIPGIFMALPSAPVKVPVFTVAAKHPFYVSVTEINHNTKDKILEISCKIFTNDFETTLEKFGHAKVDLSAPKDKKALDKLITAYIVKHLQLKVNGQPVALQYIGNEKEAEATWAYFQVNNVEAVKKVDVLNSLLYDSFDKEINIIHITVGGDRKSTRLNYPDAKTVFEF